MCSLIRQTFCEGPDYIFIFAGPTVPAAQFYCWNTKAATEYINGHDCFSILFTKVTSSRPDLAHRPSFVQDRVAQC